jgi:hypothetical protein
MKSPKLAATKSRLFCSFALSSSAAQNMVLLDTDGLAGAVCTSEHCSLDPYLAIELL